MQYLYAPWRSEYFEKEKSICPFCDCANKIKSDEELGVIFRAKHCFGVMNRYPYSAGHFMVIPYIHEEHIENLSDEIWQEMSYFVRLGVKILKEQIHANGVNIGMNLSKEGCRSWHSFSLSLSSSATLVRRYKFYHNHRRN